jgi:hypothetical protein
MSTRRKAVAAGTYLACDTDISSVLKTCPQERVGKTGAKKIIIKIISVTSATAKYATVGKHLSVSEIKRPAGRKWFSFSQRQSVLNSSKKYNSHRA